MHRCTCTDSSMFSLHAIWIPWDPEIVNPKRENSIAQVQFSHIPEKSTIRSCQIFHYRRNVVFLIKENLQKNYFHARSSDFLWFFIFNMYRFGQSKVQLLELQSHSLAIFHKKDIQYKFAWTWKKTACIDL